MFAYTPVPGVRAAGIGRKPQSLVGPIHKEEGNEGEYNQKHARPKGGHAGQTLFPVYT